MGRSRDRPSAVRKTLPPSPATARLSSTRIQDQRRMFTPINNNPTTSPSAHTLREFLDKRSAIEQKSPCLNVDAPVDADHASRDAAAPSLTRQALSNGKERIVPNDVSVEDAGGTINTATEGSAMKWMSALKGAGNAGDSAVERIEIASEAETEQNGMGDEWLRRFPLTSEVECKTLQYRAGKKVIMPHVTCALDMQERFARSLLGVLRSDAALSSVLEVAELKHGDTVAKSLMSQEELEMYECWCKGHGLPEEDWDSLTQGVSAPQSDGDYLLWTNRATDLNQIYRRNDLTRVHAKAWWSKNAAWKPLAVALAMVKNQRRQAEYEACIIVLAQMQCHRDVTQVRANRYSKSAVRRYTENVDPVIAQLIQRQMRMEDDNGTGVATSES